MTHKTEAARKAAKIESKRKYCLAHPDRRKASKLKWYLANRERWNEYAKTRRKKFPKEVAAAVKDWTIRNRAVLNAKKSKRMAARRGAMPKWANEFFIEEIYDLAKLRTKALGIKYHVDHIVPLKSDRVCGLHVENNLRVIPAVANISKLNRHWPDMP